MEVKKDSNFLEALKVVRNSGYNQAIMDAYDVCEEVISKQYPNELSTRVLLSIIEKLTDLVDDDEEEIEES